MTAPRPDLAPDPSLSREEMETLQREIARSAVFENDFSFDQSLLGDPLARAAEASSADDGSTVSESETDEPAPLIAGVDQSFLLDQDRALSAVVVLEPAGSGWNVVERVHAVTPLEIPYIPGLLSFREGGAILAAIEELSVEPDLYVFDGSGRIHFRQAGIATHIGVMLDRPSIGVAKSLLCGDPVDSTEGLAAGERVAIEATADVEGPDDIGDESDGAADAVAEHAGSSDSDWPTIGYAVQSKQYDSPNRHVNPLIVSAGHRVSAATAADLVLALSAGYKLPEPTRLADAYADDVKAEYR